MLPRLITSCRETVGEATHAELAFAAVAEFTKSASIEAAGMVSRNQERERERERRMVVRRRKKQAGRPTRKKPMLRLLQSSTRSKCKKKMQMRIDTRSARAELAKLQIVFFYSARTTTNACATVYLWMKLQMAAFASTVVPHASVAESRVLRHFQQCSLGDLSFLFASFQFSLFCWIFFYFIFDLNNQAFQPDHSHYLIICK
jgi:hypothetical protein